MRPDPSTILLIPCLASADHAAAEEDAPSAPPSSQPMPPPPPPPSESNPDSSSSATAVKAAPAPPRPRLDRLPPFRVLLHNDNVNIIQYVVETILTITPLPPHEAFKRTLEAHERGVSLLLVTHRERAELYMEQFRSKRITVSIEPAET